METELSLKDRSIIAQVSAYIATSLLQEQGSVVVHNGQFASTAMAVYCIILDTAGVGDSPSTASAVSAVDPVALVQASFTAPSGAVPTPVPPVVPAAGDGVHQPGLPKPIHAKSTMIEKLEDALYHNPSDWKVWETDKCTARGGTAPDITHETISSADGKFKVGIFLVDGRNASKCAPEWAFTKLGLQDQYAALVAAGTIVP
ncbi:MAG: hypothetical protein NZ654_15425 [Acidimicrobiales bacterium]|nr:hypothetical protein [Acidimicrobiales bacterium]